MNKEEYLTRLQYCISQLPPVGRNVYAAPSGGAGVPAESACAARKGPLRCHAGDRGGCRHLLRCRSAPDGWYGQHRAGGRTVQSRRRIECAAPGVCRELRR